MPAIQRAEPVKFVASVIDTLEAARSDVARERETISQAQARLEIAERAAGAAFQQLHEELKRMDLASSGNYGWEQRIAHFLVELRQLPEAVE